MENQLQNRNAGHQDIQYDKQDPGNLLAACGLGRNTSHFDAYVAKYMDGAKVPKISSKKQVTKANIKAKAQRNQQQKHIKTQ